MEAVLPGWTRIERMMERILLALIGTAPPFAQSTFAHRGGLVAGGAVATADVLLALDDLPSPIVGNNNTGTNTTLRLLQVQVANTIETVAIPQAARIAVYEVTNIAAIPSGVLVTGTKHP